MILKSTEKIRTVSFHQDDLVFTKKVYGIDWYIIVKTFFPWRNEVSQPIIWITDDGNQTDSLQSTNSWLRSF